MRERIAGGLVFALPWNSLTSNCPTRRIRSRVLSFSRGSAYAFSVWPPRTVWTAQRGPLSASSPRARLPGEWVTTDRAFSLPPASWEGMWASQAER